MRRRSEPARLLRLLAGAVLFAGSCAPPEPAENALRDEDGSLLYADGVYRVSSSTVANDGWQMFIEVAVRANVITSVCFGAAATGGGMLADDERYLEGFRLETGSDLVSTIETLKARLVSRQRLPIVIPARALDSHADWSMRFVGLAGRALEMAMSGESGPATVHEPGPFVESDVPDELGWIARLAVVFDGTEVVAAGYDEQRRTTAGEPEYRNDVGSPAYESLVGLTPAGVSELLASEIAGTNAVPSWGGVDAVSGATGTTGRFNDLAVSLIARRTAVELPGRLCER